MLNNLQSSAILNNLQSSSILIHKDLDFILNSTLKLTSLNIAF